MPAIYVTDIPQNVNVIHILVFLKFQSRHPNDKTLLPRLGILAVTFGDGNMRIIPIPHPSVIRRSLMGAFSDLKTSLYVKLRSSNVSGVAGSSTENSIQKGIALDTHLSSNLLWKVCWGGHQIVASGCSSGAIAIWDIETLFEKKAIDSDTVVTGK